MVNTQHKFESKIPTVQVVEFTRNHTKFILSFKANFILKVTVTSFQTRMRHLDT